MNIYTLLKKYKLYIGLILLLIIIFIGYIWANKVTAKYETLNEEIENNDLVVTETEAEAEKEPQKIKVDIKGEVNKPTVYELEENSRVIDLIKKAGGLTKNANTDIINLSQKLADEDVVIIYSNDDIAAFKEQEESKYSVVVEKVECPDTINKGCIDNESEVAEDSKVVEDSEEELESTETKEETKININTATKEELMKLSGIGESKAENIINYRNENGLFEDIEELKNISGIGDSIYEKIKDNITT